MHASEFAIDVVASPGLARVVVSGELDLATAGRLGTVIDGEVDARQDVVLDLSAARILDSTPLAAILRSLGRARQNGWSLEIAPNLSDQVRRVATLTEILPQLPLRSH